MIDTALIVSNILLTLLIEMRRSRCTDIEICDCLKIHRELSED
jgi:hypothetical protein